MTVKKKKLPLERGAEQWGAIYYVLFSAPAPPEKKTGLLLGLHYSRDIHTLVLSPVVYPTYHTWHANTQSYKRKCFGTYPPSTLTLTGLASKKKRKNEDRTEATSKASKRPSIGFFGLTQWAVLPGVVARWGVWVKI